MSIDYISDFLIPFEAHFLESSRVIWLDPKLLFKSTGSNWDKQRFKAEFSYCVSSHWVSEKSIFDKNHSKILMAERYGSVGLSGNGGGARCGNDGIFQLKGCGKNPLANPKNEWHAYGGLSLTEAVTELVYSKVLEKVMPVGVAHCFGLLYTGEDTAYTPYHTANYKGEHTLGRGAILVREACLRPAHFIENPHFNSNPLEIIPDRFRTRGAIKSLLGSFSDMNSFILWLGEFVTNCANQMAFAKLNRLYHGSFTINNVSFDGRWLDLTNASFVLTGKNYCNSKTLAPFFHEYQCPLSSIDELFHSIQKYAGIDLGNQALFDYYFDQYNAFLLQHLPVILGCSHSHDDYDVDINEADALLSDIMIVLHSNPRKQDEIPGDDNEDNLTADLLTTKLTHIFNTALNDSNSTEFKFFNTRHQQDNIDAGYSHYVYRCLLKACKRILFLPIFFRGKLRNDVRELEQTTDFESSLYVDYIDSIVDSCDWIFDTKRGAQELLFSNKHMSLAYDFSYHIYRLEVDSNKLSFGTQKGLLESLKTLNIDLSINNVDFIDSIEFLITQFSFQGVRDANTET